MSEKNKENTGYLIKPIGVVRSSYREASLTIQDQDLELNQEILTRTKTGKGNISELIINEEYKDCLDGIEDFSHIMVLYWAHHINDEGRNVTRVHPAGKKEYPLVGIFATRGPARPYNTPQKLDSGLRWIFWTRCDRNIAKERSLKTYTGGQCRWP